MWLYHNHGDLWLRYGYNGRYVVAYEVDMLQRQWLEYLEEVKKKKAAKDKARREAAAAAERRDLPSPSGEVASSNRK